MAGIGFDGKTVSEVNPAIKRKSGKAAYILIGLKNLLHYSPNQLFYHIDGKELTGFASITGKSSRYGGNFKITPDLTIVPAYASGIAQAWLSDPLATGVSFGLNASGQLVVVSNGVTIGTGSVVLPSDTTNPYRIRAQCRGNSSAVDVRVDRYGQSPVVETITTSAPFAFASTAICVGSMGSVANTHVPCKGITRLEIR